MTKLARAVLPALPLALLLAACAPAEMPLDRPSSDAPAPVPSSTTATVAPDDDVLPTGSALDEWAATALPEDRPGAAEAVLRETVELTADQGISYPIEQAEGLWDLVMTCQTDIGIPLTYAITGTAGTDEPGELECSAPGEPQTVTALIGFEGVGATLMLDSSVDAVVAYEVRPHTG